MSASATKSGSNLETRLGEHSAQQPLSGVARVDASFAVNGLGHGGFIRAEKSEKSQQTK